MEHRALSLLAGVGLGAGLMYLLDPQVGRRRRALMRDQANSLWQEGRESWDTLRRDVSNRAAGLAAEARSRFRDEPAEDRVLCERVRAQLGRVVSHPGAIRVDAQDGRVTLRGPVLADEVDRLLGCVRGVAGVQDVDNRLDVHQEAGNLSALQGGRPRTGARPDLFQQNWSPTTRLLAALAGTGLVAYGITREAPLACLLGTCGLGLLASGLTNRGVRDLLPEAAGRRLREAVRGEGGGDGRQASPAGEPIRVAEPYAAGF